MSKIKNWLTPARRAATYKAATLLGPVLVGYGVLDDSTSSLVLGILSGVLGTGLAALFTNTGRGTDS